VRQTGRERGRLRALALTCALGLLLGPAGCLNPRPEEDPSANVQGVPEGNLEPSRESCMSNPALPECAVPIRGGEGEPPPDGVTDEDEAVEPPVNAGAPPAPASPTPPEDAGASAVDTTSDAGVPVAPRDASAP
jgi:hypothetical protein